MSDDRIDDIEERMLVLRDKAAREGFAVPPDVLDYIAEKYALPQTLKGALINVQAYASRRDIPVTMDIARLVLDGIRPSSGTTVAAPVESPADAEPPAEPSLVDALESALGATVVSDAESSAELVPVSDEAPRSDAAPAWPPVDDGASLFVVDAPPAGQAAHVETLFAPPTQAESPAREEVSGQGEPPTQDASAAPAAPQEPTPAWHGAVTPQSPAAPSRAVVWFAPMRSTKKESLVARAGKLLGRAGLRSAIAEGDLVAVKLHFGEAGNTGFVHPVFLREVVRLVREVGGKPFLTDANTLYRGERANAVDHLACAIHNGFSFATVDAPLIIADGIDGRDGVDVPISGYDHFDSVRIGAAAVHADAMVVVTHVKGHEATGMGGALKNVGMGLGCRSAKQRMHSDLKPQVNAEKCTACGRCVKWCPVRAIAINPDRVAQIDYELCYGCGECVASCPYGAIAVSWETEPDALQEKIVEHAAGALTDKDGKVVYLSFVTNVSPDCDCWHFSDASVVPDIGVLASADIVAIDQAAHDLITQAHGLPGSLGEGMAEGTDKLHRITGVDPTLGLRYAEAHGLGSRSYELRTLD